MRKAKLSAYAGIRVKLFISMFGMCLLLFCGMLYTGMKNSQDVLIEQKSQDMSVLVGRTGQFLDVYLQNISSSLYSIINSEGFFTGSEEHIRQILKRHIRANPMTLSQLYFLSTNGTIIASDPLAFEMIGNPHLKRLYDISMTNPDLILWSKPYYSPLLAENTVAFSLVAKNPNQSIAGLVVAEVNLSHLSAQLSSFFVGQNQTFVILNESGDVLSYEKESKLLPFENQGYPQQLEAGFAAELSKLSNGVQQLKGAFHSKLAVRSNNNHLGWSIIELTDEQVFQDSVRTIQRQFFLIGTISLVLLLVLSWHISRAFTQPIKLLALQMDRIREERMVPSGKTLERQDEIGQLSRSFDAMMTRIHELMEKQLHTELRKKEVELKMLMSQIRPHFLYNTLNSISYLARQNCNQDVEETIRSLIRLLSFSIDKKEDQVTLAEELDILEAYMQIQNIRYGHKIHYVVEVPDEDKRCLMPKLLLQPLVENAIFHGLARKASGTITVRSLVYEGTLSLFVVDDGEGLDISRVKTLLDPVHKEFIETDLRSFNSIGLANVQERIRLLYGEPYGLYFDSQPSSGTEIEICIPFQSPRMDSNPNPH